MNINMNITVADPGFPRGGGANSSVGDFAKFPQKLHEIERIWTGGGVHPSHPLRSATVLILIQLSSSIRT